MEIGEVLEAADVGAWRAWLTGNHSALREIWVVFRKKAEGPVGLTYEALVQEALCFGWVDGQMKRIDGLRYAIRFTPRRAGRPWAESNRARAVRLMDEGRMTAAGAAVLPPDLAARCRAASQPVTS